MASPVFSISNRNSTSRARTTFELSLGSRKAKTSAISAPGSAATKVASAWSAALMGGAVDKVNETPTNKARAIVVTFLRVLLKLHIVFLLLVILDRLRLGG